jgi:hypothetical protein
MSVALKGIEIGTNLAQGVSNVNLYFQPRVMLNFGTVTVNFKSFKKMSRRKISNFQPASIKDISLSLIQCS